MNDLGPAAREMVEAHRRDRRLSDANRARMKQKLMLRVSTLGATTAVAGTAAGMSLAAKIVVVALGVTAAVGAGSLSLWVSQARAPSHMTSRPVSVPMAMHGASATPSPAATPMVASAAPASAPAAGPVARPAVASASASSVSVDSRHRDHAKKIDKRPVVSASESQIPALVLAPAPAPAPDPEPELRALREARDDLRAGRPASAYRRLDDFDRQNRGGMLVQERRALSAIALCLSAPGLDAQARAAEFLRSSPESPLATRVRSACEKARSASP